MKTKNSLPKIKKTRKNKTRKIKNIIISSSFESGNCKIININYKPNFVDITLTKKHEPFPVTVKRKYENWFYFKVSGCKNRQLKFDFKNLKFFQNNFNIRTMVANKHHQQSFRASTIFQTPGFIICPFQAKIIGFLVEITYWSR